ncbi:BgTH12-02642 [Blumeria graminis f. sp. triticale]|uniref:BgTH12-02642 n=1 Tax=Blumeria graminis f. sp. triticale TaxID=1689686 RepID=A0A9W4D276_BLUGR|nr:BgTH12-02642 [Blumeria graminis f. sp. triticale]
MPAEFRQASTGSLSIPPTTSINGGPPLPTSAGAAILGRFDGPRSPPGRQNTSHVPCKFFRAGACQAGNSCPFSHDPASTTDNICKYFAKGNCKFGPKCANIHVLPDGRRISYTKSLGTSHLNLGTRLNNDHFQSQKPGSAISTSFLRTSSVPPPPYGQHFHNLRDDNFLANRQAGIDIAVPSVDSSFVPSQTINGDEDVNRFSLRLSPGTCKINSALDATLPSSFDGGGASWITRNGPMASSVPAKFSLDTFPDFPGPPDGRSSETLKKLHHSVFGDETRERWNGHTTSPPVSLGEEYLSKRSMQLHRSIKRGSISANVTKAVDRDWEANFTFEEDYLPETLKDLMTPQEKARRGSRNADEEGKFQLSGTGTPNNDVSSKFSSPSNTSPSRWGSLFQRQQQKEDEDRVRVSAFGHVGSPLRNSTLNLNDTSKAKPIARPSATSESSSYLSTSPRHCDVSITSQQLQRTHLSHTDIGGGNDQSPNLARATSSSIGSRSILTGEKQKNGVSSVSGVNMRYTAPIDEEHCEFVFSMEGDETVEKRRNSSGWPTYGRITESPRLTTFGGEGSHSQPTRILNSERLGNMVNR